MRKLWIIKRKLTFALPVVRMQPANSFLFSWNRVAHDLFQFGFEASLSNSKWFSFNFLNHPIELTYTHNFWASFHHHTVLGGKKRLQQHMLLPPITVKWCGPREEDGWKMFVILMTEKYEWLCCLRAHVRVCFRKLPSGSIVSIKFVCNSITQIHFNLFSRGEQRARAHVHVKSTN